MADVTPQEFVELGAGSVAKVQSLLRAAPVGASVLRYVPLDIDAGTIAAAGRELESDYPDLDVHGIVGDFQQHLGHVPGTVGRRLVVFFGSTIGNLDAGPRRQLLDGVRGLLSAGGPLLVGARSRKERRVLEAAYDDRASVTAAFNRNILRVVNRGLGGNFVPEAFRHHARYDADASRIEMHLVAGAAPDGLPARCGSDRGGSRRRIDLDGELVQVHARDRRSHAERLGPRTRSLVQRSAVRAGPGGPGPAGSAMNAETVLTTPTPRTLYVHDDLTDVVRASHGDDSEAQCQVGGCSRPSAQRARGSSC
jgi:hypothetical protein